MLAQYATSPGKARSPVTLDVLDATGKAVRTYSSSDPVRSPHPALDPEGYNRLCQQNPSATFCNLPLYWPAPAMRLSTSAGMHRFSWDMRYAPVNPDEPAGAGDLERTTAQASTPISAKAMPQTIYRPVPVTPAYSLVPQASRIRNVMVRLVMALYNPEKRAAA